ncbi:unannotated protein [freshwater metagenome]|uniref:Unannotated protein n=1 Tax=freshwater metagenome TaxID=449393 RepID=A0A6J6RBM5_9ZZZZ
MRAANESLYVEIFVFKSARSTLPNSSQAITTTFIPAITALAAFVPCALDGIKQISLAESPSIK